MEMTVVAGSVMTGVAVETVLDGMTGAVTVCFTGTAFFVVVITFFRGSSGRCYLSSLGCRFLFGVVLAAVGADGAVLCQLFLAEFAFIHGYPHFSVTNGTYSRTVYHESVANARRDIDCLQITGWDFPPLYTCKSREKMILFIVEILSIKGAAYEYQNHCHFPK